MRPNTTMAVQLHTLAFLCCCLCNALSLETTITAFSQNDVENVQIYINIVNPLDTGVLVNISAPHIATFTIKQELVPPKDVIVIEIDTTDFEITGTGKSGKGILIQSNVSDLIITGLSTANNSGDMYFARKCSQLGTEYIIITYCIREYICQLTVIADEDNTVIQIIFPGYFASAVLFNGTYYGPGDVMTLTLQQTQTFQIQSTSDLSGVRIMSINKKTFSVLSGSSLTSVRTGDGRDHIADMVPPIAAWGSEYVLVRRNLPQYGHDYVKFVSASSGANISIIGCGAVLYHLIREFQTYSFNMMCERVHVISDEPVLIAHFPVGVDHGDPAMFFPTPINHYVSDYTVYIPPGFRYCAITLVMKTLHANTFNLSKVTDMFSQWKEIEQSVYSTSLVDNLKSGVLEITHTSPFGGHVICEKEWTIIALPIGLGNVTLKGTQIPGLQTYSFNMTCERVHVISDEPVLIAHFPVGVDHGDPAMFFPTPMNHYVSEYTVYVPPGFSNCAIAVVTETIYAKIFTLSTATDFFTQWKEIEQSAYSTAWINNLNSGVLELAHTTPFGGHVICEQEWTIIALAIVPGNLTLNEPQECFATQGHITSSATASTTGTRGVTVSSNTTANVSTNQTHTNVSEPMSNCSCCMTPSYLDSDLPPPELLLETINDLKKTLSVPKKTTSNYIRKLTSAWDKRTSSAAIGAVGVVVLSVVFGSIIAIDIATLFQKRR